ncbi:MAG: ketoacyl-ACP synthase [Eubacterium sp.]|jgi:3-oxoacyl-[acyl-carrier-protein] synthase-3|nr:ketoacyl-ACP synthase [Eubacterium sp.]
MQYKSSSIITAAGAYLPDRILSNHDLEKLVETSDEWIVRRTGVKERRISKEDEFSSDMAIKAVENLLSVNSSSIDDVDMIIVTTFTADHITPAVSAVVQGHFGIPNAGTMDINSACAGFVYGLCVADSLITSGSFDKILLISSETMSKIIDYTDRNTCIIFGDAATAVILEKTDKKGCILASNFNTDGKLAENITCSSLSYKVNDRLIKKNRLFEQEGKFLYEYIVRNIPDGIERLLKKADLTLEQIDWFVPHSANLRMIEALCKRLDFPMEKTLISNEYYGNTSSVSIPLAIWMALQESRIRPGDKIVLYGFGSGLTYGGIVLEW